MFFGHYWRRGTPEPEQDWTDYTACVDFSAVKRGALTAYRWSGETKINPQHYVWVSAGDQSFGTMGRRPTGFTRHPRGVG